MELFTVAGTTYRFPDLTPKHRSILDRASKVKAPRSHRTPTGTRPPKPGNGEFSPDAGEPGATVYVKTDSGGVLEGCVMFPAPDALTVWVSFWDGEQPVLVTLARDDRSLGFRGLYASRVTSRSHPYGDSSQRRDLAA